MKPEQHYQKILCCLILFGLQITFAQSQPPVFPKITGLTNARITASGDLEIFPSNTSSSHDFDFLAGKWTMDNKRLKTRLNNSNEWEAFVSKDENYGTMLNGIGNMDLYKATFDGKPFEGLTLRLFNPQTKLWSLYWVPSTTGIMTHPWSVPLRVVSEYFIAKMYIKVNQSWSCLNGTKQTKIIPFGVRLFHPTMA